MNKNFWLFTVVCALFVSAVTTVLSLSGALALPILVFPVLSLVIVGLGGQYFHFFIRPLALLQIVEL